MQNRQEWNAKKDTAVSHSMGMADKIDTAPFLLNRNGMQIKKHSTFSLDRNGMQERHSTFSLDRNGRQNRHGTFSLDRNGMQNRYSSFTLDRNMEDKIDTAVFHS